MTRRLSERKAAYQKDGKAKIADRVEVKRGQVQESFGSLGSIGTTCDRSSCVYIVPISHEKGPVQRPHHPHHFSSH